MLESDKRTIESLTRQNQNLRAMLLEQSHKEAAALQAAQETKRTEAAQQTVLQEVQLEGTELEKSRVTAWLNFHLHKQIADGRGGEVFNFDLIRPTIAPNTWPPGDGPENYTRLVSVSVAEAKLAPDVSQTRLGKMLAEHKARRAKMEKV